MYQTMIFLHR